MSRLRASSISGSWSASGSRLLALAGGVVEHLLREQPDQAGHGRVPVGALRAVQRQVERQYGVGVVAAEDRPRRSAVISSKSARAASRWVTTMARGMPTAAHSSHTMRVAPSTPSGGRDDEKGRVRRSQTGPELPDEVGVSGGVQQIDLVLRPIRRGPGRAAPSVAAGARSRRSRRRCRRPRPGPPGSPLPRSARGPRPAWSFPIRCGRPAPHSVRTRGGRPPLPCRRLRGVCSPCRPCVLPPGR